MKTIRTAFVLLFVLGTNLIQAQTVTVSPSEYDGALANPLKGFRPSFRGTNSIDFNEYKYPTLVRHYIYWNDIEDNAGDGVAKIIDFCNAAWAGCEDANVKIIPRVILQYGDGEYYWPSDLPEGDYSDPRLKQRVRNMIEKLGEAWNNDPRIAWVQTGIIGKWGEQESPVGVDEDGWLELLADEYLDHLPNKTLVVRNQNYWTEAGYNMMGAYWDSFGHTGQYSGSWSRILEHNENGRYLVAPIEGEVAYDWGNEGLSNYCDTSLDVQDRNTSTVSTPEYYNFIINTTKQLHTTANGWISGYDQNSSTELGAEMIQKAFGYRYKIDEFEVSTRVEPGNSLSFTAKITNEGSAPIYENWPVAFVLVDEATRQIVLQQEISGVNIRDWHPGSDYDWDPISNTNGSKVYLNPAQQNTVNGSVSIPSGFSAGEYLAGIAIIDPSTQKPGVFFAAENFLKESQSQPLCRIGVGVNPSTTILDGVTFDDPLEDDNRSYSTSKKSNQTISFPVLPEKSATDADFSPEATASSGLEVSYISSNTSVASIVNGTIRINDVGSTTITARQLGDANYNAASAVSRTLTITALENCSLPWSDSDFSVTQTTVNYNSGAIDISCAPSVTISMNLEGIGPMETFDYCNVYYKVDGGPQQVISENVNAFAVKTVDISNIRGDSLEIIINSYTSFGDETYYISNIKVVEGMIDSCDVPWSDSDFSVTQTTVNYNSGAIDISCAPSVTISMNLEGIGPMETFDYCNVYYKVDGGPQQVISENVNVFALKTVDIPGVSGNSLEIIINSYTSYGDETYYISNISVSSTENSSKSALLQNDHKPSVEAQIDTLVKVYPNPTASTLSIDFPDGETTREIQIFNLTGQLLYSAQTDNASITIDVKPLNFTGMVLVQIKSENLVSNHKVIIE